MDEQTKIKLLYVLEALYKTDEDHGMNANTLLDYLQEKGIKSERKSVARDITVLQSYGYPIERSRDNRKGFYMAEHPLDDFEIKMIADAVTSAKFITYNDAQKILQKLRMIASPNGNDIIENQTFLDPDGMSKNNTVKYNIDSIIKAIKKGKKIAFQYYEINPDGSLKLKRDGHRYVISPYYLVWVNNGYFLIGNSQSHNHFTHFHVEMITHLEILEEDSRSKLEIEEYTDTFNLQSYLKEKVNMYSNGKPVRVTINGSRQIVKDFKIQFGDDARISPLKNDRFKASVKVSVNEGFIRWLSQFSADDLKIIGPQSLKDELRERAEKIAAQYK